MKKEAVQQTKTKKRIYHDVVFKSIFLREKEALITMIQDITGIDKKLNKEKIITGYELEPYTIKGKVNKSDMLVSIGKNNYLNIEINYRHEKNVTGRNLIQLFRIVTQTVKSGMTLEEVSLKMVAQLNINTFRNENNKIIQKWILADEDTGKELEVIKAMLNKNIGYNTISEVTNKSIEEIKKIEATM